MIPRLHKRGTSFKGVCRYILHDPNQETADRVLWADTLNVLSEPANAWREMHETARDQALLKQHAGKDARGRKNKTPCSITHSPGLPVKTHRQTTCARRFSRA